MTSRLPHRVVFAKKNEKQKKNKNILKNRLVKTINWKKRFTKNTKTYSTGRFKKINKNRLKKKTQKNQKKSKKNQKKTKKNQNCSKMQQTWSKKEEHQKKYEENQQFCFILPIWLHFVVFFCILLQFWFFFDCSYFFRFFFDFSLSRFLILFWVGFWFFFESSCFWFSLAYSFLSPVLSPFLFFYFFQDTPLCLE